MKIHLKKACVDDAELIFNMQISSFAPLLEKYKDFDTNPGNDTIKKVIARLEDPLSSNYLIIADKKIVGSICVVMMDKSSEKRISPLFILPQYNNKGIAQAAIREAERIHGKENWTLETALQEEKNCHLYEKMGYKFTGKSEKINERLTLILFAK